MSEHQIQTIKAEYLRGEIFSIDAIEALQALGWSSRDAETEVYSWEDKSDE